MTSSSGGESDNLESDARLARLEDERLTLAQAGNLHWFHWSIIVLSGILTIAASWYIANQNNDKSKIRFERETSRVIELIAERMMKYEDALWAGTAVIHSLGGEITRLQWQRFVESLRIEDKYPGINGIGVVNAISRHDLASHIRIQRQLRPTYDVHPKHNNSELLPIVYIEPEQPNQQAVGLDLAHEENRYQAVRSARRTGEAQITGPILLVQDEATTPGFLFYVPYYTDAGTRGLVSEEARLDRFAGLVYAPLVVSKLLEGTLGKDKRHLGIRITDGGEVIYDEYILKDSDYDPTPLFTRQTTIEMYGRNWHIDMLSDMSFRNAVSTHQPLLVLAGGLILDGLLLALFFFLSRVNRRALRFADQLTATLLQQTIVLSRTNGDLESFAYIASHDLKTPVRGIGDLTSYLEEDLDEYINSPSANPDVSHNLSRLKRQTQRMDNLIRGILDYSTIGRTLDIDTVDLQQLLADMRGELEVSQSQLYLASGALKFETYGVQFEQVLRNLIENAFKYHDDREQARVVVSWNDSGQLFEFCVSDNGPGIESKFHGRIFEAFQKLQSKDEVEGSGIGLSIVKRTVETVGGTITLESRLDHGSLFTFTWPKNVTAEEKREAAP